MHIITRLFAICTLFVALAACTGTSYAATKTFTLTEERINQSYAVNNPRSRSVTSRSVDLQPGQVVVNATVTRRAGSPVSTTTTLVPSLLNGRVVWTVTAVTANDEPVSDALLAQIKARNETSWGRYMAGQRTNGRITAVAISDSAITYTCETARSYWTKDD